MALTIEQALNKGVIEHKAGNLQDAERFYRAILQSQPHHADANHNLGVLAFSVNKADVALSLFKTALEANPKVEQFWLSYIDCLIKLDNHDAANKALIDAKQIGLTETKLKLLDELCQTSQQANRKALQWESGNPSHNQKNELFPAIELRETGRYKEAEEWLNKFIVRNSKHPEALSLLAQVLLVNKKEVQAESVLSAAASINSELPSVYRNQARLLLQKSKPAEALKKAQLNCELFPEALESLHVLAACFCANKQDSKALTIIEKILKSQENYPEAYANRALIRMRTNDVSGAIEDAEKAVKLKPHLAQIWSLLASLYSQCGNIFRAIDASRTAHEIEPQNTNFLLQLSEFLRQDDKTSEAIPFLRQAAELTPKDSNVLNSLGVALQQDKQSLAAKSIFKKALDINPQSARILSNLGTLARETKEWELALDYFNKAIEIQPNLFDVYNNLGTTLKELDRLDAAEASYQQSLILKPNFADVYNNLANLFRGLSRLPEGQKYYTHAIMLMPKFPEAHNNLGNILSQQGKSKEAEPCYIQAIKLKPEFPNAHRNLGITLNELGKSEEAVASFKKAIILEPDSIKVYDDLGHIQQIFGKFEEAEVYYKKCIFLAPLDLLITKSMASRFMDQGDYQTALGLFDSYNTPDSRSRALECLQFLGKVEDIYQRIEYTAEVDDRNIMMAAFSSYIAEFEQKETAHRFCKKPLEFLHFSNLLLKVQNPNLFIENLIEDLKNTQAQWQPPNQSARGGFQTVGNLFRYSSCNIVTLKEIILDEIDAYYEKFKERDCSFIHKWPVQKNITGWHVMLKEQGYHRPHIHPSGWLSGVIYLKVVPPLNKNEGAIKFSVGGSNVSNANFPKIIHNPEVGDMILFPSSLYHGTIPFSTDTDRIVISFDLKPDPNFVKLSK